MLTGSNRVEYQAVQAFSADPRNGGIISGGTGDQVVVTEGTSFSWVYDPNNSSKSGFTGVGWFESTADSPINASGISLEVILDEFQNGTRTNLNDVFAAWQSYIEQRPDEDIVTQFVNTLVINGGGGCWSAG